MNIRKKLFILSSSVAFACLSTAFSQEARVPCLKENGGIGLKGLDKYDCSFVKAVVNDPKIKTPFQDKILNKLADQISVKASQRLEELALLDQYFSQNASDLLMNSKAIKDNCKLDVISTPKCGSNTNRTSYQKKLNMILSRFPDKSSSTSLYDRMRNKFSEMRGVQVTNNQCPLSGTSGSFFLSSQLTESEATNFINSLKEARTTQSENYYTSFPQLKLLKNSMRTGPEGEKNLQNFEAHLKNFDGKTSPVKFINDYLFTKDSQQELAKGLASQCESIAKNIKTFLCDDLDNLGMPSDLSDEFFAEDSDDTNAEIAKGFSCGLNTNGSDISDEKKHSKDNTISTWHKDFDDDVRPLKDATSAQMSVENFCNFYSCKDPATKNLKSCLNGGPVTSSDIEEAYCKKASASSCLADYKGYISYLASLEKDEKEIYMPNKSMARNSTDDTSKPKSYSSFYQNFLGVEGTLLAEGKKLTPIAIEEKKAEFAEKKLDPTVQTASLSQSREVARVNDQRDDSNLISRDDKSDYVTSSAPPKEDQFRRTFNSQQFAKSSSDTPLASTKSKGTDFSVSDSQRVDEMKQLRNELADAISKVKGSDDEKLAAVADNNAMAVAPKNSKKDTTANLSTGEKDRLNSYRDGLSNWESRLRNWEGQLSDRDVRANSGNGPSGANDARSASANSQNDQGNSSAANASSLKLTKAAAGGSAGAKADGVGDRAPGAEKVDGETGVVNSENLATLQKDSLKKLGIVTSDSFIIKVRYQDKIYSIPVKTFNHDGKSMFVPLLSDKNRELSKIVYESPLFKDYRDYQIERQYKLDKK